VPSGLPVLSDLPGFDWRSLMPFKPPETPGGPVKPDPRERQITSYLSGLTIAPIGGTQLVRIHYDSPDPRLAANSADAHAGAYIENILESRLSVTQSASRWMAKRVDELRSKLQESEAALQAYREQEKLIDAGGVQSLPTLRINDLTARLVDARRRLSSARIAYLQVYGESSGSIESVPAILLNSAVQQFRQVQAQSEQKVAELAKRYGPKHPKMIAARSELAEATENLDAQQRAVSGGILAEYRAGQSEVSALERELDAAKQEYQEVSRKGAGLDELQREVETNRQLYELFYSRMRETAQTGDLDSVNARIVQAAVVPTVPIRPQKKAAVMMAFAFSLAAGIAAAFLLEQLSNTIRSSSEVEDKIGLPLLGSVPMLSSRASKQAATAVLAEHEKGFGEAIRTIRTGLSLSDLDDPNKVILVTSSIVGEGKSTVAMNLALAFAKVERVLLLDGDMRRPSIARELNLDRSTPGLPELLASKANLNKCITFRDDFNLEILKTGTVPLDPLEMLAPLRFSKIMNTLRTTYDRIIIDSPPLLHVSDAAVLSTHADSIVYVVKFDSTSTQQVKAGLQKLPRHHVPIAGIVLNQVDSRKAESYGDHSYDGYYEDTEAGAKKERRIRHATAASL
ncbi:MAG: polysaccharide biosynthesis tyrosine autokinase, partial [Gammaproteobacteria bacterium]|nr:polysaccharide biosynthesis tyrosine autokinase [Gammaproteobacteria bacterium]